MYYDQLEDYVAPQIIWKVYVILCTFILLIGFPVQTPCPGLVYLIYYLIVYLFWHISGYTLYLMFIVQYLWYMRSIILFISFMINSYHIHLISFISYIYGVSYIHHSCILFYCNSFFSIFSYAIWLISYKPHTYVLYVWI